MPTEGVMPFLEDRAHGRRDRWQTFETSKLPEPFELNEPTIVSRYTRCGMVTHTRHLLTSVLVSVNGCFETPSAVARDYLMLKYKYGPKWTTAQRERIEAEVTDHPLYCRPTKFKEGAYIDLRAAYWSVMLRAGWDVNYNPGEWLAVQDPPVDFPWYYDKRARNSLVSVARSTQMTVWRPDKGYTIETRPNKRPNSQLYCLIMDVLNAVAFEAVEAGAVYVFADGYISPDPRTTERIIKRVEEWGFGCRIKGIGRGEVYNVGSYRVGDLRTKHASAPGEHDSIKRPAYLSWLKDKLQWMTDIAPWHEPVTHRREHHDRYSPSQT